MYLIPLRHPDAVWLVANALLIAAGKSDCTKCPVVKRCQKQCESLSASIVDMLNSGALSVELPTEITTKKTMVAPLQTRPQPAEESPAAPQERKPATVLQFPGRKK